MSELIMNKCGVRSVRDKSTLWGSEVSESMINHCETIMRWSGVSELMMNKCKTTLWGVRGLRINDKSLQTTIYSQKCLNQRYIKTIAGSVRIDDISV